MIRYVLLQDSAVVNVIEVDPDAQYPGVGQDEDGNNIVVMGLWACPDGFTAMQSHTAQIGWTLTNGALVDPNPPVSDVIPVVVPTLSDLQAQLAALTAQIQAFAGESNG